MLTVNLLVFGPVSPLPPESSVAKRQHKGHNEQEDTDQHQIIVLCELVKDVRQIPIEIVI